MPFEVLLVNPNQMKPAVAPLALDYLADSLVDAGYAVSLLDLCFSPDYQPAIAAFFRSHDPSLIAVSFRNTDDCYCTGQDFFVPRLRQMLDFLRGHTQAPIVLGGVGFSIVPEAVLGYCGVEFGIVGDGEEALTGLAHALERGEDYRAIAGLVHRTSSGFARNPPRPVDLAKLPRRRRALIDNARYFREGGQGGFETKRGCAMACVYCADPVAKGRKVRLLPPARVADELEALNEQGVDCLHTCDPEFNLPLDHAEAVCGAIIERRLPVTWYAYASPAPFTPGLAQLMRRAGCLGVNFGVDSGSDAMLAALGRSFRAVDVRETAHICRQADLACMFDLMLGGPGETPETTRQSIDLMREVEPDRVGLAIGVRVYPGTKLARRVAAEGVTASNPNLRGAVAPDFFAPVFYLSAALGADPFGYVAGLVGGDQRFFLSARGGSGAELQLQR
ncbi:MAG: cobalamin-dependent protein [Actinobacteria bacterium]|nr:cobalamin-dependent protein [Actinomycetota bacterium]